MVGNNGAATSGGGHTDTHVQPPGHAKVVFGRPWSHGKKSKKKVENKITFVSFFKKSPDALGLYTTTFSARIPFPESFLLCDDLDANLNVSSV